MTKPKAPSRKKKGKSQQLRVIAVMAGTMTERETEMLEDDLVDLLLEIYRQERMDKAAQQSSNPNSDELGASVADNSCGGCVDTKDQPQ